MHVRDHPLFDTRGEPTDAPSLSLLCISLFDVLERFRLECSPILNLSLLFIHGTKYKDDQFGTA